MNDIAKIAAGLTQDWCADEYAIHKRPPFKARSFDDDGRFCVVGTTRVSVLHGAHGDEAWAQRWANALNETLVVRTYLENSK